MRYVRFAGLVLCIIGLLLAARGLYEFAGGKIYQVWRGRQLDQTLQNVPLPATAKARHVSYAEGSAIGRLEIPRIGVSVVVLEGSDTGTLRLGVGRVPNSSLPNESGNVVLAGHRDTFFRPLREIRQGDRISLRTPEGAFPYVVDWTEIVNPTNTSVLLPTSNPALTLVTCYPFNYVGAAPQRFIVRALPADAATISTVVQKPSPLSPLIPLLPKSIPATHHAVAAAPVKPAITAKPSPIIRTEPAPAEVEPSRTTAAVAPVAPPRPPTAAAPSPAPHVVKSEPVQTATAAAPAATAGDSTPSQPAKRGIKKLDPRGAFHKIGALFSRHGRSDQE